ncbi:hypothetical protein [Mesorhizobium sp.]|uniref:hypothetical protein n=1 Tax=Mesorhizobium sp. TaxID=1871066 RepID=UPI000FEA9CD8|nr:hypothetical protein [Mesorhizobium sp.]RWP28680.1 MAG: hypothetical protein EOR03_28065 [Mesorhizobium sp.]
MRLLLLFGGGDIGWLGDGPDLEHVATGVGKVNASGLAQAVRRSSGKEAVADWATEPDADEIQELKCRVAALEKIVGKGV